VRDTKPPSPASQIAPTTLPEYEYLKPSRTTEPPDFAENILSGELPEKEIGRRLVFDTIRTNLKIKEYIKKRYENNTNYNSLSKHKLYFFNFNLFRREGSRIHYPNV
jgi:hypothetical protein